MATKSRGRSGGLRFSEEEFAAMSARVRGSTVTASGSGYTESINTALKKPVDTEYIKPSESDVSFDDNPAPISDKTTKSKIKTVSEIAKKPVKSKTQSSEPIVKKSIEDPDWTAPRTVKVARRKGGTTINMHIADVIQSIKTAIIHTSVSEEHISLVFDGARMLTLNEILAILPFQPYLVYNYKKAWVNKIDEALMLAKAMYKKRMPEFTESCLFIGYRRSTKLVDRDGLASCFKYILDDLRNQLAVSERILKDDNPNLIFDTPCFQTTGPALIGIRLERVYGWKEPEINEKILLSQDSVASKLNIGDLMPPKI